MTQAGTSEKIWYLQRVNLFEGFEKEEMMALARMTQEKTYRKKEIIYLPGQPGNHVYLLKKGVVKISKITADGHELTLALLKPGEMFGEVEAMDQSRRDTQAEAHSETMICMLGRDDFLRMVQSKPHLGIRLSKLIGWRRRVIENRLENVLFRTTPQKLARLLLDLTEQFGEKTVHGVKITVSLTHNDLANLIGAARATLTETLNDFRREGWIQMQGKSITVLKPDILASL